MKHRFLISLLALFSVCAIAINLPVLTGPLMDDTGLLQSAEREPIESALRQIDASGKAQLIVFIANSLAEQDIESFSVEAFEHWKPGKKGKDNGLLLVIAPHERRMRLEVGYGLEGDIPDAVARRILDNTVRPFFKAQRYGDGVLAAVVEIGTRLGVDLTGMAPKPVGKRGLDPGLAFVVIFLGILILLVSFANHGGPYYRGGGGWGGGGYGGGGGFFGGGGGGFSGGGGSSGGGGASSSW